MASSTGRMYPDPIDTYTFITRYAHQQSLMAVSPRQGLQCYTPPSNQTSFQGKITQKIHCKRRIEFGAVPASTGVYGELQCTGKTTERRNARERNRVKNVNDHFNKLRDHVPCIHTAKGKVKKLSKVEILKSAMDYIQDLRELLDTLDNQKVNDNSCNSRVPEVNPTVQGVGKLPGNTREESVIPSPVNSQLQQLVVKVEPVEGRLHRSTHSSDTALHRDGYNSQINSSLCLTPCSVSSISSFDTSSPNIQQHDTFSFLNNGQRGAETVPGHQVSLLNIPGEDVLMSYLFQ